MSNIGDLPSETIEGILLHSDPLDVAAVAQSSRIFRSLVYHSADQHLWRALYLAQPFDDPRECVSQNGIPRLDIRWKEELQRIMRARTVVSRINSCGPDERCTVLRTLLDMVCYVPPLSSAFAMDGRSQNLQWVAGVLKRGAVLDHKVDWIPSDEEHQLRARLHTYFGLTDVDIECSTRVESRGFVYNMRNYQWGNAFGPFMMDSSGCVNWLHVQALHHVVSMHIVDLGEGEKFDFAVFPMSLPYTQIVIPKGVDLDQEQDWAGVQGRWRVSFCFCDHRELLIYNESAPSYSDPLDTSIFEDTNFREIFRSLDVELFVVNTSADPDHPSRPKISFLGEMADTSRSTMNGYVQMTPDDQVRWHFVSGEQGNAIWSSEGIQIGGLRSSFGVIGSWTTIFHDGDDPIGPFWLRKTCPD